jgi:ornithine cyclodeaminase
MIHFTDAQIERALRGADLIAALRDAFVDLAGGRAAQQERRRTEAGEVKLSTLGAVVPRSGFAGAKVYTTVAGEFNFVVVLFSARTGRALATFEAAAITRRRTAAVSVLAAGLGVSGGASTIAIFGTGVQARAHAEAFAAAYPNAALRIVGRHDAAALAADFSRLLARPIAAMGAEAALDGAQVVVTATRAAAPLFEGARVERGAFVAAVGSSRPDARELDDALMARAACVVVEWKEQALREAGELVMLDPAIRQRLKLVQLGDALAGAAPVRSGGGDIVVFKSVGVGIEDVAVAGLAYRALTGKEP